MKAIIFSLIFTGSMAVAQTPVTPRNTTMGGTGTSAISVKDAKEECKKEGKEGKELLQCIKEKTKK